MERGFSKVCQDNHCHCLVTFSFPEGSYLVSTFKSMEVGDYGDQDIIGYHNCECEQYHTKGESSLYISSREDEL